MADEPDQTAQAQMLIDGAHNITLAAVAVYNAAMVAGMDHMSAGTLANTWLRATMTGGARW